MTPGQLNQNPWHGVAWRGDRRQRPGHGCIFFKAFHVMLIHNQVWDEFVHLERVPHCQAE